MSQQSAASTKPWFIHDQEWQLLTAVGDPFPYLQPEDFRAGRHRDSPDADDRQEHWLQLTHHSVHNAPGAFSRDDVLLNTRRIPDLNGNKLDFRLLVITGDAGLGKSSTTEWIQYRLLQSNLPAAAQAELCFRFDIAALHELWDKSLAKDRLNQLVACLTPQIRNACEWQQVPCDEPQLQEWLRQMIRRGQLCLILDGLDQVGDQQWKIIEQLLECSETSQCRFILASRPDAIHTIAERRCIFQGRPWRWVRVVEFNRSQQKRYLEWLQDGSLRYHAIPRVARNLLTIPRVLEYLRKRAASELQGLTTSSSVYSIVLNHLLSDSGVSSPKALLALAAYECIIDYHGHQQQTLKPDHPRRDDTILTYQGRPSRAEDRPPEYQYNHGASRKSAADEHTIDDVLARIRARFEQLCLPGTFDEQWGVLLQHNAEKMNHSLFEPSISDDAGIVWSNRSIHEFCLAMYFAKWAQPGEEYRLWDWIFLADQPQTDQYYHFWRFLCEMPASDRSSAVWLRSISLLFWPAIRDSRWNDPREPQKQPDNPVPQFHAKRSSEMIYRAWPTLEELTRSLRQEIKQQARGILTTWQSEFSRLILGGQVGQQQQQTAKQQLNDFLTIKPLATFSMGTMDHRQLSPKIKLQLLRKFNAWRQDPHALIAFYDKHYTHRSRQFLRETEEPETLRALLDNDFPAFCRAYAQLANSQQFIVSGMPAFQIGRRSVTNAEYRLFDPTWGLSFRTGDGYLKNSPTAEHPAVGLSFYDCWVYTRWLSGTHETIRMLFEEEWEYCAKMGLTASQWWWDFWFAAEASPENMPMGGRPEPSQKCLRRSIDCSASPASQQLDPLRQGIRGLQLNHWTWCEDIYRPLYSGRVSTDSIPGPADSLRVLRGGSWRNEIAASVSWHRAANDAAEQGRNYGLRLARSWKR